MFVEKNKRLLSILILVCLLISLQAALFAEQDTDDLLIGADISNIIQEDDDLDSEEEIIYSSGNEEVTPALSANSTLLTSEQKAEILNKLGMLKGDPVIGLMLDIKVRRSDAAVFFTRLLGKEQYVIDRKDTDFATTDFPDALEGSWYTPYISYCVSIGLIAGRTDGMYYPDDSISEKEFANVLLKILGYIYQEDYDWDTVYEFAYDIGLFEDSSYATRTEDNREYYRKNVCDLVFSVLAVEKKDSTKLLIEELVENGSISIDAAAQLGFDLSNVNINNGNNSEVKGYAEIENIYHLEKDLIWIIFTQDVTIPENSIEITETYDFSKALDIEIESMTKRDLLIRTGTQIVGMDYTIDINDIPEADQKYGGMLSFDFLGFDPKAKADDEAGLTTKKREDFLERWKAEEAGGSNSNASPNQNNSGNSGQTGTETVVQHSGNADVSVEYFRVINAYTTASNQVVVYFSQPISETAVNDAYYSIYLDGNAIAAGSAKTLRSALLENTNNAIRLTTTTAKFVQGTVYQVRVSGSLFSNYTTKLNEGADDNYTFTASAVKDEDSGFSVKSVKTTSQYALEIEFSQAIHINTAKQTYNYFIVDNNGKRYDISAININESRTSNIGTNVVRLSIAQPFSSQATYSLTVVYAQNETTTASIANMDYFFNYAQNNSQNQNSTLAITTVTSEDPSTIEIYFDRKIDKASAEMVSNYGVNGNDNKSFHTNPVKAYYDPIISPYKVKLFFTPDKPFVKDQSYALKVFQSIRDEELASPKNTLEMHFFSKNSFSAAPGILDAAIVGENIIKMSFTKEILYHQNNLAESNFSLEVMVGENVNSKITPSLVKYIDPATIILRFDSLSISESYRVRFTSITDYSGQYRSVYPEQGSSLIVRQGKK